MAAKALFVASANEQTESNKEEESKAGFPYGGYPGRGGGYPGGGGGYPGRGGGRGGYCRYCCCNRGFYGGCRCCSGADEIPEPMYRPEVVEVHN